MNEVELNIEYRKFFPSASFDELFDDIHVKQWTPAEGGMPGQGSVGNTRPSVTEETWIANMFWSGTGKPKAGTKFLMTVHGKRVVVVMVIQSAWVRPGVRPARRRC